MILLPIVERELRVRARRRSTHWFRVSAAAGAIGIVGFLLVVVGDTATPASLGGGVFRVLTGLAFAFCLLEGFRQTADCLSEEKRAGTLGLLFLTDLKGYDVVLGKFSAASLNSFYALMAIFPPLAIPLVLGGVAAGEFWRQVLVLLNALFFSLTLGLMMSAISRQERKAWGGAATCLATFSLVLPLIPWLLGHLPNFRWSAELSAWQPSFHQLALLSPTTSFLGGFDPAYRPDPDRFWNSLALVCTLSGLFLLAAITLLPRCWQDAPLLPQRFRWPAWLAGQTRTRFDQRRRERWRALLASNPIVWLAERSEAKRYQVWTVVALAGLAGLGGSVVFYGKDYFASVLFECGLGLHLSLSVAAAGRACYLFAGTRDSGMLELLLSTPLTAREIVDGHLESLRRLFYWPVATLLFLELLMLAIQISSWEYAGESVTAGGLAALGVAVVLLVMVLDLYATSVFGMWLGLSMRKPSRALVRTLGMVLVLPHLTGLCFGLLWPLMGVAKNLIFIQYGRDQLRRQFRLIVAERYGGAMARPRLEGTAAGNRGAR